MAWSDLEVIRDIISVLATQGWEKIMEDGVSLDFVVRLIERFTHYTSARSSGRCSKIKASLMQYAVQFISLATLEYRAVWWRIFHAPTASEWSNVLILIQLLFSLPASNGKLERVFSQMNVMKTNKRSLLSKESLSDLLLLSIDSPPLKDFCPDPAIDLWWKEKLRRPNQHIRKEYRKYSSTSPASDEVSSSEDENDHAAN